MISKVYILAPNCIIVTGHSRCTLLDLQKNTILLVTKSLSKLISKPISPQELRHLGKDDLRVINELIKHEVLLLIPKTQAYLFPKMNRQFHNVSEINNIIIELNAFTISFADKILESLNNLNCKFVELRISKGIKVTKLYQFLKIFSTSTVESITIYIEYINQSTCNRLLKMKYTVPELSCIYIYNIPAHFDIKKEIFDDNAVVLLKNKTLGSKDCGNISPFYFSINIPSFTEAINYNSCLNCKISIKENGDIKQCPSIKKTFGNIKNTSLESVVSKNNFSKLGQIKKDQIKVCRDCEFRYACSDCRAYVEDPKDIYSKPLKCGYNPYTGEWEEWSTNPLKQNAIKYYEMEHLVKIEPVLSSAIPVKM